MRFPYFFITIMASMASCQHRGAPIVIDSGCETLPLVGGPSHVDIALAQARDSTELTNRKAGLFVIVRWSSDSLAKQSRPVGAVFELTGPDTSARVVRMIDSSGVLNLVVAADGPFHLRVRRIAGWRVDTSVVLRGGYVDTARVHLQYGGMRLCS